MWIEKRDKNNYLDSSIRGLRVRYENKISQELKSNIKMFISWIRKIYFFPIRISLIIKSYKSFVDKNNKRESKANFYYYNDSVHKLPFIWVATGQYYYSKQKRDELIDILFTIAHELTHYYQWYFDEIDDRSDRSLEIEANRWASYLIEKFLIEKTISID